MGKLDGFLYHGYELDNRYSQTFNLQWHLTVECDQRCKHCYMFEDQDYFIQRDNQLTTQQAYQLVDELANFLKKLKTNGLINITGGDPILSHNFWDILQYMQKHSDTLSLGTIMGNSYHINDEVSRKLKSHGVNSYQISLDGLEDVHDEIRKPGSFKDALRALKSLHKAGIETYVMATAHKDNCQEIFELYKFLSGLDYIDCFAFDRMIPIGNAKKELNSEIVDNEEYRELMHKLFIFEVTESKNKILTFKDILWRPFFYEMGLTDPINYENPKNYVACVATSGAICVVPDGSVYACRRLNMKAGKFPEESLEEIILNSSLFREMRNLQEEPSCGKCSIGPYCGGCPAMKYAISGRLDGVDPNCCISCEN